MLELSRVSSIKFLMSLNRFYDSSKNQSLSYLRLIRYYHKESIS